MTESRTITVDALARVEGEGALHLAIEGNRVTDVKFRIVEPPRFFEAFLRGRHFAEAPDITARICGICPVAYQMSAVHAMESACGVTVPQPIRALRRLLYCGEWIESHVLHAFLLHIPDFLGYPDAITLAGDHPDPVKAALTVKKAGNAIVRLLGGREIHPVNVKVGGFYTIPERARFDALAEDLDAALDLLTGYADWIAALPYPEIRRDTPFLALRQGAEYPYCDGRLVSTDGIDAPVTDYERVIEEVHVAHSTALQGRRLDGGSYLTGPMARVVLNADLLTPKAKALAKGWDVEAHATNPFRSLQARIVETVFALEEALAIIAALAPDTEPSVPVSPRAGVGCAATEAPRGLLYHRYEIGADGLITAATIVPPTSQNQQAIEADLRAVAEGALDLDDLSLRDLCEHTIRNYDPCISCATHFLTLTVDRKGRPRAVVPSRLRGR